MIDEDLYQQATDELNSDKRQPHIWARACALASDDHDEARYLYTNLRVEELITEREASGLDADSDGSHVSDVPYDATLSLEPLDLNREIPESISAPSGVDQNRAQEEILTLNTAMLENNELIDSIERKSFRETVESHEAPDSVDEQEEPVFDDEYLDETINLTSELDGTAVFELDKSDATEFDDDNHSDDDVGVFADKDVEEEKEDELEALLGGVYQGSTPPPSDPLADDDAGAAPMILDFSEVSDSHTPADDTLDESLEWLEEEEVSTEQDNRDLQQYSPEIPANDSLNDTARLAQELERQADELPGQRSDIVAVKDRSDDPAAPAPGDDDHDSELGIESDEEAERVVAEIEDPVVHLKPAKNLEEEEEENLTVQYPGTTSDLPAKAAMAATGPAVASHATVHSVQELPVDLSEQQSGTRYTVFLRGDQAQAVRNGVSWPALFLTLPYLIYRHLFGTALVYAALWLIVLVGLLVSGLAWLDAGTTASTVLKFSTAGFAVLAVIGLLYLPFRHCNQWREDKLEQRGFELIAWVRASSPGKAISAARRATKLK